MNHGTAGKEPRDLFRLEATCQPAKEETQAIVRYCYERGLIVLSAGTYGNVIRLLVPLIISDEQLDEGFGVLEEAMASVCKGMSPMAGAR